MGNEFEAVNHVSESQSWNMCGLSPACEGNAFDGAKTDDICGIVRVTK